MNRYFEHVRNGFWLTADAFGLVLCCAAGICMVVFGAPFYLISKFATRKANE